MKEILRRYFTMASFCLSVVLVQAQDLVVYGGYVTSDLKAFRSGWNAGLLGRYDFTKKYSQDLDFSYARTKFNEAYLKDSVTLKSQNSHTDLFSIRTHALYNVVNTAKERFSMGGGICVNFFGNNSPVLKGATNMGFALVLGYENYNVFSSPWGVFTRLRAEYDPALFGQDDKPKSVYHDAIIGLQLNAGITYTIKNKAE